jgi:hypothetical protein
MNRIWVASLLVLGSACVLISNAAGRTWFIKSDGTGDAPTVQAGVDSAAVGDTVLVGPGTFADTSRVLISGEPAVVCAHLYKNIVLRGSGPENTTLGSPDANVAVYADLVGATGAIEELKITTDSGGYGCVVFRKAPGAWAHYGILCESSSLVIRNNELFANDMAMYLLDSPGQIANNEIHGSVTAITLDKSSDAVIECNHVFDCGSMIECRESSPVILDNVMHDTCGGMYFGAGCSPVIRGNYIHHIQSYEPQAISSISGALVENNRIENVYTGIFIMSAWPETRIVRGNVFYGTVYALDIRRPNVIVENNTIDVAYFGIIGAAGAEYAIRNNIITRADYGIAGDGLNPPTLECNDVFGSSENLYSGIPDPTGTNGNISADPEYCGIDDSGNYYLQSDSPCAPGNHPNGYECGLIGSLPVNCGKVGVERKSWGTIKSLYRRDG